MSCHMREINPTNHSLSCHSSQNQTPCCPSNFFPRTLFKKVHFTLLTFPAQLIEQWCHCYFPVHNSTCPSHPYPRKKNKWNKIYFKKSFKKNLKFKNLKLEKKPLKKPRKKNLGKKTQILSWQRSSTPLSHAVDRGSPVLHTSEFLWSDPWAVSSNSQRAALTYPLVTRSRLRLACAPCEGVFAERSLGSQLKFSADSARPPPCHMQSTAARLCSIRGRLWEGSRECFPRICPHLTQDCLPDPYVLPYEGD